MTIRSTTKALLVAAISMTGATANDVHPVRSVTETDVVIIGGGSGGTYAAISLLDKGIDFIVVEQQVDLGGHADTYTDPTTGSTVNAGVQLFHSSAIVKDYFARLGVPLGPPARGGNTTTLAVDFTSGQRVANPASDAGMKAALDKYRGILNTTYTYLEEGYYLPDPVPADLLLPFGEFARKNGLSDSLVFLLNLYTQGWDISKVPAVMALVIVNQELVTNIIKNDFLATNDTNDLYRAASAVLGSRVLYSTTVKEVYRTEDAGVTVTVQTKCGSLQTIKAKKLLMTGSPVLPNLKGWDLTAEETELFTKFHGYGYFAGAISNPDLPENVSFTNVAANEPFHVPALPALYSVSDTSLPNNTHLLYYATNPDIDHTLAAEMALADVDKLIRELGYGGTKTSLLAWYPHGPFNIGVSSEEIAKGFYKKLYGLQGKMSTWWTGSTFTAQDSAQIWVFTKALLESLS